MGWGVTGAQASVRECFRGAAGQGDVWPMAVTKGGVLGKEGGRREADCREIMCEDRATAFGGRWRATIGAGGVRVRVNAAAISCEGSRAAAS